MSVRFLLLPLLLTACASARTEPGTALRMTASHYESMTGVAVTSDGNDATTTCRREMITGSHILRWYCSFRDDSAQYLLDRHIVFAAR